MLQFLTVQTYFLSVPYMFDTKVILTDRRDDVLANLRENVELNGLAQRGYVAQLAWGGRERETGEIPAEIWNQSPFKVQTFFTTKLTARRTGGDL